MKIHLKRLTLILLLVITIWLGATPTSSQAMWREKGALAPSRVPGEYEPGEVLVRFATAAPRAATQRTLERYGMSVIRPLYHSEVQLWRVPEGRELEAVAALNAAPDVLYAEPNYIYQAFDLIPNDPYYDNQWAHPAIQSPAAWDITTGLTNTIIAIIDTGVDLGHPDLVGKLVPGHDFVDDDNTPSDANGHGTHVAGLAAAFGNNGVGVAGMAWEARIMPVRVLDAEGLGNNADITDGITWAYQNGADVLNLSLGGPGFSHAMQDGVNAAHAAGSLVVAAMGNCRTAVKNCSIANPAQYPAALDNVLAVAATDRDDNYAYYSQYGPHCDIAAPGGELMQYHDPNGIYSTMPTYAVYLTTYYGYGQGYDYLQGTSQATPYVSGLAALIWAMNPTLTPAAVQNIIEQTADDLGDKGKDEDFGWGRINAYRALAALVIPGTPVLDPIDNLDGNHTYTVTWSTVSDAVSYELQESAHAAFSSPMIRYSGSNNAVLVTGQQVGVWYYRVRAVNAYGNAGNWSDIVSVTVLPAAPVMTPIDNPAQADAYTIGWSAVSNAPTYVLVQDATLTFSSPLTRYVGAATSYTVTGQAGGTWYYRVRAGYGSLIGPWSAAVSTTVAAAPLAAPTLSVLSDDGDGDYTLDWDDIGGATVYTLEESLEPYFTHPAVVYAGDTSVYTITGQAGGQWYYRVRAVGPAGRSPWSIPRTVVVTTYVYLPVVLRNYIPPLLTTVIPNGDFESGLNHWSAYSQKGRPVIVNMFDGVVTAHGGSWAGWLGGDDKENAYLQRQLGIPPHTPYLIYWYWIDSKDACNYDFGRVYVANTLHKTYKLCSPERTNGWVREALDLRAYSGLTVTFSISVTTDSTLTSSLFLDDLVLQSKP